MFESIVAIAAHTDDLEIGCAGMLHSLIKNGDVRSIDVIYYTPPANVIGDSMFSEEYETAMKAWGFKFGHDHFRMHYRAIPVREFPEHRQRILQHLYDFSWGWRPDLVLIPSFKEFHQDHKVVSEEALRVFRHSTILGYEMPMISLPVEGVFYFKLDEDDIEAKIKAISAYRSQAFRDCMKPGIMKALAEIRGNQIGIKYAECFEVLRWISR